MEDKTGGYQDMGLGENASLQGFKRQFFRATACKFHFE
jgi:hypothetical protein